MRLVSFHDAAFILSVSRRKPRVCHDQVGRKSPRRRRCRAAGRRGAARGRHLRPPRPALCRRGDQGGVEVCAALRGRPDISSYRTRQTLDGLPLVRADVRVRLDTLCRRTASSAATPGDSRTVRSAGNDRRNCPSPCRRAGGCRSVARHASSACSLALIENGERRRSGDRTR